MKRTLAKLVLVGTLWELCLAVCAVAQPARVAEADHTSQQVVSQPLPLARRFETSHEGVFGGRQVHYKAVVKENFVIGADGKRIASIFTTSYIRTDTPKGSVRPVIFAFNGGPGSASLWLHMGFAGPRRVEFSDVVKPETAPPFRLADNPDAPLDVADIVLIDPPGTGFSRLLLEGKPEQIYSTQSDAKAIVDLIQSWVRENDAWNSPRYLLSESYGTIRAAVVARLMAGGPLGTGNMEGMTLNGIILLGQAMDTSSSAGTDGRYVNLLPTLAATACYHGKIKNGCTADAQVVAAKRFAADRYLKALYAGSTLSSADREAVIVKLAELTGLSADFVRENDLRISASSFAHELLREQGKEIGIYDSRYTLPLESSGKDPVADDPAMGQYVPGFVAAYNMYARHELGVSLDDTYQPIAFGAVNAKWDYGRGPGIEADTNYALDLAVAMRRNPQLRLMIGEGCYDMITPLGLAEYTVSHAGIPQKAVEIHVYPSGHMPYLGAAARQALARDVRAFVTKGGPNGTP